MTTGQNEQQWLAALQQDCQRVSNQVNSVVPQGYEMMSPAQITAAITYLGDGINFLRDTYTVTANSLRELGSPGLYIQLQKALQDMQNGKNMYESMINPRPAPLNPSPEPSSSGIIDAINHSNDVIMASMLNQCWNCHMQFGAEEFLRLSYCPNCNAMLHK